MRLWTLCAPILALALPAAAQQQDYTAANADRQAMLDRLGIAEIRAGADGFNPSAPNAVNYDEAKAGTPQLPDMMRLNDGRPVRNSKDWDRRRREIVELFDREIYGRVPLTAPKITWNLVREEKASEAGIPVTKRWLEGVADNRDAPQASATIRVRYTLPDRPERVPVMLSFGFPEGFKFPGPPRPADPGPPYTEQLLKRGWGYAVVVANSIQADNGGELKTGVIGISLRGGPPPPPAGGGGGR
ncbi:hypothetical protein, partial [Sphingomonas sp. OTU376]|uniref:hypothetical protein n=1 Tax=Sphingomonas sp. OTU376 TaxID=3043863 RepID=UPI00313E0138